MKAIQLLAAAALLLGSCHKPLPERTAAGFINGGSTMHVLMLDDMEGGTAQPLAFAIDDDTRFEGGAVLEGNIAEVTYRPARDEQPAVATLVVTDATYPEVLGRWATPENAALPVAIELLTCGRVAQSSPAEALAFTRWGLSGRDGEITLTGTLTTPDDGQTYPFVTAAELSKVDGNRILTLKPENGPRTELHFVE